MDPDVVELAQVLAVLGSFATLGVVLFAIVRVVLVRTRTDRLDSRTSLPRIDEARFTRLEEAVDAIAVEVERIGEGQRFTAKFLSERAVDDAANRGAVTSGPGDPPG